MAKVYGGGEGQGGLHGLSVALHKAADKKPETRRIVKKNAKELAKAWQELHRAMSVHGHARKYPPKISMDMDRSGIGISAEIGPKKSGQGNLGNLIEFGSRNNEGWGNIDRALNWQEPKFLADMREVANLDL